MKFKGNKLRVVLQVLAVLVTIPAAALSVNAAAPPVLNDAPGNLTVNIQIERDGFDYLVFSYTVPDSVKQTANVDFHLEMRVNGGDWITADSYNPKYNLDPIFVQFVSGGLTSAFYRSGEQASLDLEQNYYEFRSCFAIGNQAGSPYSNTVSLGRGGNYANGYIRMTVGSKTMNVNGEIRDVDPGYNTAPVIINGRTLVPIRAVVEAMGGNVGWDADVRQVTLNANGIAVAMYIGSANYYVNGQGQTMDTAPVIIGGRTLIPVRFAAEALGCQVNWDPDTREILITYGAGGQAAEPRAWVSQQESMELLATAISDKLYGSYAILPGGEDFIGGEHVWLFDYGDSGPAQFVATEHYAVGDSGAIYRMDVMTGEYQAI